MVQRLQRHLWPVGSTEDWNISSIEILRQNKKYLPEEEIDDLVGKDLCRIQRHGKKMLFDLGDDGFEAHNSMSGYWDVAEDPWTFDYVEGARQVVDSDVRVRIRLQSRSLESPSRTATLRFHDSRLFGYIRRNEELLVEQTPEIMVTDESILKLPPVSALKMMNECHRRWRSRDKLTVRDMLLDQKIVLGIVNIYAAEGLWRASVHPSTLAHGLDGDAWENILGGVRSAMADALLYDLRYDGYLRVYRRERCLLGHKILCEKVRGRSSYFCGECQKKK